jgi:hypothetical protein
MALRRSVVSAFIAITWKLAAVWPLSAPTVAVGTGPVVPPM